MSATIIGATNTYGNGATINCAFPPGTVAGDTAIVFSSSLGGVDPGGWTQIYSGYYGAGNPVYGRAISKQLDAADILTGYVTLDTGGAMMASLVALEGSVEIRMPFTVGQTLDGNPHTVNSDANVETGDTLLFYAGERDWDDNVWTSGTILTRDGQPIGMTNSLMTFDAPADGVNTAQYTTLWGGNKYHAVLAVNSSAPANSQPIVGQMAFITVTTEFVIPQILTPFGVPAFMQTFPYFIGE